MGTPEIFADRESAIGDSPRGLPASQSPASHLSLDNFARFKIAPSILNAVARKGNDVGSVVIHREHRLAIPRAEIDPR